MATGKNRIRMRVQENVMAKVRAVGISLRGPGVAKALQAGAVPEYYKLDVRGLVKLSYDYRAGWTPDAERHRQIILAHASSDWGW